MDGIHVERVNQWFKDNVAGAAPPLTFELIAGGKSNLTFKVTDSRGQAFVLRRPPLGHVLATAHDMAREYKIISPLYGRIPVARTYGLCMDTDVNGAPFYVMGYVDGIVLDTIKAAARVPVADRRTLGFHIIDTLAALHQLEPEAVGLGDLGRREDYIPRQLKRWTRQYEDMKTEEIPQMDECTRRLHTNIPKQIGGAIVHGDYRPGNLMCATTSVMAVLDWELCTLGDPLADVGYLLNMWTEPPAPGVALRDEDLPTMLGGFPSIDEMKQRYSTLTGRDLASIDYYRAFSHWRLAAIMQGVYKRFMVGAMGDQQMDLSAYKTSLIVKAEAALALL